MHSQQRWNTASGAQLLLLIAAVQMGYQVLQSVNKAAPVPPLLAWPPKDTVCWVRQLLALADRRQSRPHIYHYGMHRASGNGKSGTQLRPKYTAFGLARLTTSDHLSQPLQLQQLPYS
jgi:hypothetical protein